MLDDDIEIGAISKELRSILLSGHGQPNRITSQSNTGITDQPIETKARNVQHFVTQKNALFAITTAVGEDLLTFFALHSHAIRAQWPQFCDGAGVVPDF